MNWLRLLARRKFFLVGVVGVALILAVIYLRVATYTYTATLSVTPVDSAGRSGLASQLGGLGGLASLAGVSLPVGVGNETFQLYVETLRSRAVANELARDQNLMTVVFYREWDPVARKWRQPDGVVASVKRGVILLLGAEGFQWHAPDGARMQDFLEKNLSIDQSPKRQVVSVAFSHGDPAFAARFLRALHSVVDDRVRQRTLARTSESISYLTKKLATIDNVEHQKALAQALSEQEKLQMLASSSAPFAAEPFGEPEASSKPTQPQPVLVLLLAIVAGLVSGCGWILVRELFGGSTSATLR